MDNQYNMVLRRGIRNIEEGMKIYDEQLWVLRTELHTCRNTAAEQGVQLANTQNLLEEQEKQTVEYANRLEEKDKMCEVITRRISTLLQELNKCKAELQLWRSQSPGIPAMCSSCNQEVTPVLPPGQVLVNQGVKPEHTIILQDTRQIQ